MEILIGSVVSLLIQLTKKYLGTERWVTVLFAVSSSLVAAVIYYALQETNLIDTAVRILTSAGAFYAFILKQLE